MEISQNRFKIGVFGSAAGSDIERCQFLAFNIGKEIAISGGILCTGACPGLPHEAALGAQSEHGIVLGFSPAMNLKEHIDRFKFPVDPYLLIFTGMERKGRNIITTRTCDAGIFISGRFGTLNEFTLMYDEGEGKVIGMFKGSGGYVDEILIPSLKTAEKTTKARIIIDPDSINLVRRVFRALKKL